MRLTSACDIYYRKVVDQRRRYRPGTDPPYDWFLMLRASSERPEPETGKDSRKKVMLTLGGGGHLWQSLALLRNLDQRNRFCYISTARSAPPEAGRMPEGRIYYVSDVATLETTSRWQAAVGLVRSFFGSLRVLRQAEPSVVVCVGTAISVPILLATRCLGIPGVYVESVTRIRDLSNTGKIIYRLGLAKRLYVQWPEVHAKYDSTLYYGTVM